MPELIVDEKKLTELAYRIAEGTLNGKSPFILYRGTLILRAILNVLSLHYTRNRDKNSEHARFASALKQFEVSFKLVHMCHSS